MYMMRLEAISEECPTLEVLELYSKITVKGLESLKKLKNLTNL